MSSDSDKQNNIDLPLQDIITPEQISAWPPAPGWYLLATFFILFIGFSIFYFRRYRKKWLYRHEAMRQVNAAMDALDNGSLTKSQTIQVLLQTLKQTAMSAYPNQVIDGIYGEEWISLLEKQAPEITIEKDLKDLICQQQYQNKMIGEPEVLATFCLRWIRKHHHEWLESKPADKKGLNNVRV